MKKGENHTDVFGNNVIHIDKIGDREAVFRASDIASALGYSNVRDFVRRSVLDKDKLTCYRNLTGEPRYYTYVTINGARSMIASCKKPVALEIERWLETEKLPSIFDKRIGRPLSRITSQKRHVRKIANILKCYRRMCDKTSSLGSPRLEITIRERDFADTVYDKEMSILSSLIRKEKWERSKRDALRPPSYADDMKKERRRREKEWKEQQMSMLRIAKLYQELRTYSKRISEVSDILRRHPRENPNVDREELRDELTRTEKKMDRIEDEIKTVKQPWSLL